MSKSNPEVVVIILNYNGISDTTDCLKSLLKTRYTNFKIIVGDNGSKLGEIDSLKAVFKNNKKIDFVSFNENLGFSEGNNRIIKVTKSKYVVLLNNDTKVEPGWLGEMIKIMESDNKIAACQGKIRSMLYPAYFDYAGAAGGFLDKLGFPYARGRIGFHLEKDLGQYDDEADLFWGSGTCLMLRRKALDKVGLLPSDFFFYHEETDLCWRFKNQGYRIVFCPKAVIFHKGAGTSRNHLMKRIFYVHRNNLLLITRNLSLDVLWFVLPQRLIIDFLSAAFYLANGRPAFVIAVAAALGSFFVRFPLILFRRLSEKDKTTIRAEKMLYPFSIFWNYFFLKKRKYSDIRGNKSSGSNLMSYQIMFSKNKLLISRGERSDGTIDYLLPTFHQHNRVYKFCLKFIKDKTVMDAACGTGYGAFLLCKRAKRVFAFDRDIQSIKRAQDQFKDNKITFYTADICKEQKISNKIEVMIALQIIEHLKDPHQMLEVALKQMKKRGVFILSTPNKLTQGYNKNPYHIKEFDYQELNDLLKKYFPKVTIYGLHGDELVNKYEEERKRSVMRVFKYDLFGMRDFLPVKWKILFFEFFTRVIRKKLNLSSNKIASAISEDNFYISRLTKESTDLIAVCEN